MSDENTPPTADTPLMSGAHPAPSPPGVMAENNPKPPPYVPAPEANLPGVPQYNPPGGQQMYPPAGPKNYPPDGPQNYPAGGPQNYPAGGPQMYLPGAPQTTGVMAENYPEPPPYVPAPEADLPGVPQNNPPGGQQMYPPAGPKNYLPVGPQNYPAGGPQNYPAGGPQNYPAGGPQNYPAGGPQNYPAGGPQMCLMGAPQTTVIMAPPMQSTIHMGVQLKDTPAVITCPYCLQTITTRVSYTAGLLAWAICGVMFLFGLQLGCCLIPFCIDGCKDVDHSCPICNHHIYKYKRIG